MVPGTVTCEHSDDGAKRRKPREETRILSRRRMTGISRERAPLAATFKSQEAEGNVHLYSHSGLSDVTNGSFNIFYSITLIGKC